MSVSRKCCTLSDTGLHDRLIHRPEETYGFVCALCVRAPLPAIRPNNNPLHLELVEEARLKRKKSNENHLDSEYQ